jgi:hypothetical protein
VIKRRTDQERSSQIEGGAIERKEIDHVKFFLDPRIARRQASRYEDTITKIG